MEYPETWLHLCWKQFRRILPALLLVYIPAFSALSLIGIQNRIHVYYLVVDTASIVNIPFYYGLLSNIGILIWCATAAICLFSSFLLHSLKCHQGWSGFLLYGGILTGMLVLDDFFMLHEEVYPTYLGIPEKVVYLGYAIVTLGFLVKYRKRIFQTDFLVLLLGLGFFMASVLLDMRAIPLPGFLLGEQTRSLLENGAKFLGIVGWATYFIRVGLQRITATKAALAEAYLADTLNPVSPSLKLPSKR